MFLTIIVNKQKSVGTICVDSTSKFNSIETNNSVVLVGGELRKWDEIDAIYCHSRMYQGT